MTSKAKYWLTGVLLLLFVLLPVRQALATPQWLKCSFTPSIIVTGKNPNASDYYSLNIMVKHLNKSDDKIITAIFDKQLIFSALFDGNHDKRYKIAMKFTKVNKMELYPGQIFNLAYAIRLDKIVNHDDWKAYNRRVREYGLDKINKVENTKKGKTLPYFK